MSFDRLLIQIDNFHKRAALFKVPEQTLAIYQRAVLRSFCSMVLANIEEFNNKFKEVYQKNEPLNKDNYLDIIEDLNNARSVKQICKNYGATSDKEFLDEGAVVNAKIQLPNNSNIQINIPIYITSNPNYKKEWSENINFKEDWKGLFTTEAIYIYINRRQLESASFDVDEFINLLNDIRNTTRHELQHAIQFAMKEYVGIPGGLPSKSLREKGYEPGGSRINRPEQPRLMHSLRDIEFYTDLTDAVQDFKFNISQFNLLIGQSDRYLNHLLNEIDGSKFKHLNDSMLRIAPALRNILLKAYIGQISINQAKADMDRIIIYQAVKPILQDKSMSKELIRKLTPYLNFDNALNMWGKIADLPIKNNFFNDLSLHAPQKYAKATKEFYKAIQYLLNN